MGEGAYSLIACLSHLTIYPVSLPRRSTVAALRREASNICALFHACIRLYVRVCVCTCVYARTMCLYEGVFVYARVCACIHFYVRVCALIGVYARSFTCALLSFYCQGLQTSRGSWTRPCGVVSRSESTSRYRSRRRGRSCLSFTWATPLTLSTMR